MTETEPAPPSTDVRRAYTRLRATLNRTDRDFELARKLFRAAQPPVPDVGPGVRVEVDHRSGHPTGTDWWAVSRVGACVRVVLADTAGPATPAGASFPVFVRTLVNRYADLAPGNCLREVNRELLALDFDDPPVVAMTVLHLDAGTGKFAVARAGAPKPVVGTTGETVELACPGPLLGVFVSAVFEEHAGELRRGEKVVLKTDGESTDDSTRLEVRFDGCG